jgi:hypothetical protein
VTCHVIAPLPRSSAAVTSAEEAIVLDDAPMVFDDRALLVEDEAAISSLPDGPERAGSPPNDGLSEVDVIEVGTEVLFDA